MRRLHTNQVFFYRRRVAFECWSPLCATADTHEHTHSSPLSWSWSTCVTHPTESTAL